MNVKENRISNWILGLYWIFIYLDSAARRILTRALNFSQMVKTNDRAQAEKKEEKKLTVRTRKLRNRKATCRLKL